METTHTTALVAVYAGRTLSESQIVAVSADPALVAEVCSRLVSELERPPRMGDETLGSIRRARAKTLRRMRRAALRAPPPAELLRKLAVHPQAPSGRGADGPNS